GAHRPQHFIGVRGVDVVVDDDDPAVGIRAGVAGRGRGAGLFGVARVHLTDRDHRHQSTTAGFVRPDSYHTGHTGPLELVPDQRRTQRAAEKGVVVGRFARNTAEHDRIVAIQDRLDVDDRLRFATAGVIAGPFTERAFLPQLVGWDLAFDHDLGG